ncbi:hypothetical protein BKA70DRAFT_1218962 [Coprinopsis sp. MPI-PUGE-AT-0042]|nr:hypothetical protein BKA70DRAFT_1218962 [Coprinopsis sp. MPI-PUGE-AT-0042]
MPSLLPTFHETLGAASVGFSLSCGVFGILTTMIFIYFRRYPQDTVGYKVLACGEFVRLALHCLAIESDKLVKVIGAPGPNLRWLFDILLHHYTIWQAFGVVRRNYCLAQVMIWIVVATIVKTCFAIRVWKFSHGSIYVTGPIFFLILCQLAYCIRGFQVGKLLFAQQLRVVASLSLGIGMVTDAYIAITLCGLLHKLRTGFKQSDTLINTLIVYAISTGALTGVVSFICLLVYNLYPRSFYFMIFYFLLGKLYAISLVTTINTRRHAARGQESPGRTGAPLTFNPRGFRSQGQHSRSFGSEKMEPREAEIKSVEINVHRMVSVSTDPDPFPPSRRLNYNHIIPDLEICHAREPVPNRRTML